MKHIVCSVVGSLVLLSLTAPGTSAQQDTLALTDLLARALAIDPRVEEAELQRRAARLRIAETERSRRPSFLLRGDASYQSEVTRIPLDLGGGQSVPEPPKERYEAALDTDWALWDGGVSSANRGLERARLDGELAALDTELDAIRLEVVDTYFSALLLQEQTREAGLLLEDLGARLAEVRDLAEQGVALAGDTLLMRAEYVHATQQWEALVHELHVARDFLARLTGTEIGPNDELLLPDLAASVARYRVPETSTEARASIPEDLRVHPQYAWLDAQRSVVDRRLDLIDASRRPRVSLFGQLSFGSPGYEQFTTSPHEYWRAGLRVQWSPWDWGSRRRQAGEVEVQRGLVATREAAFTDRQLRALQRPLRTMAHMESALATDEEIIALREAIELDARSRLAEQVISAAAYNDIRTDVQEARIARARHRTELARAHAHYLITLGAEIR